MSVSLEDFHATVELAKLDIPDTEVERYREALGGILDYVAQLSALNVDDVAPMTHAGAEASPLRPDQVRPSLSTEAALSSAAKTRDVYFHVPQVTGTQLASPSAPKAKGGQ